jgi:hypothetical protein
MCTLPLLKLSMTCTLLSTPVTCIPWLANMLDVGSPMYPKPMTQIWWNSIMILLLMVFYDYATSCRLMKKVFTGKIKRPPLRQGGLIEFLPD